MNKNNKNKRNTLGYPSEVEFNVDPERISISNVSVSSDFVAGATELNSLHSGFSVMHGSINFGHMIDDAFYLTEGSLKEVIGGLISQIGYTPTADQVNQTYEDVKTVVKRSAAMHSILIKLTQIQSGRQAVDVNGRYLGTALFNISNDYILDPTMSKKVYDEIETIFDDNISNAVWMQKYVTKLQSTYTTPVIRALMDTLFRPIFELSQGISPKTSYANIWPRELYYEDPTTQFNAHYDVIVEITRNQPFVVQVLSLLGFQTGSEAEFTRALDQRSLTIEVDNPLIEKLMSTALGWDNKLEPDEINFVSQFEYGIDETPVEINTFASIPLVSVINAIRGRVHFPQINICGDNKGHHNSPWGTVLQANLLSTRWLPTDDADIDTVRAANVLNLTALNQIAHFDFDHTFRQDVIISDLWGNGSTRPVVDEDHYTLITGYGTFYLDESSIELARRVSSTALLFGGAYKDGFVEIINKIPGNIITTK